MNAGSEALNILPETRKRAIPYCKIAFGNVAPTLELLGLGGMQCGMLPTFPKWQGGGSFGQYYRDSLDCGYPILWQAWQFLQGDVLGWILLRIYRYIPLFPLLLSIVSITFLIYFRSIYLKHTI